MKKLIPVLLSLFMVLALTGGTALAETVYTESALNYTITDESITITGYFGKDEEVTIPASIAGIPVNTVAKGAFADSSYVKTVNLPDTITTVEEGAFAAGITVNYNSNIDGGSKPGGDKPDNDKSGRKILRTVIRQLTIRQEGKRMIIIPALPETLPAEVVQVQLPVPQAASRVMPALPEVTAEQRTAVLMKEKSLWMKRPNPKMDRTAYPNRPKPRVIPPHPIRPLPHSREQALPGSGLRWGLSRQQRCVL
ncbi:MAG: hypothetical protein V8S96_05025 [Lachnospiraceae bacterium]